MRRSLLLRSLITSTLIVLVLSIPLAIRIRSQAEERALTFGRSDALALAPIITLKGDTRIPSAVVAVGDRASPREVSIVFADDSRLRPGEIIYDDPLDDPVALARARRGESFSSVARAGRVVYEPVLRDDDTVAVIRVFVPQAQLRRGVARSWLLLALLGTAMVLLAVLVFDRIARSVVHSVRDLAGVADSLGRGDLRARAAEGGPDEVRDVAGAVNRLADRVEELIVAERVAVADLSHRLRTPITALRAEVGTLPDKRTASRMESGLDEISRQVDQIIREVREPKRRGLGVAGDITRCVGERVAFWRVLADDQHRNLHIDIAPGPVFVPIVDTDISALLDALLDNVFSYTPEGAAIAVSLSATAEHVTLRVDDDGPGFAVGFGGDPGRSLRGSTGIGLDFVRRTVEAAGGSVAVANGPGGGASVRIDLPRLPLVDPTGLSSSAP